jgi:hypothetical protein
MGEKNIHQNILMNIFFYYHLLITFSAKPKKSLILILVPSSNKIFPENFPKT